MFKLGRLELEYPFVIGAGVAKSVEDLRLWVEKTTASLVMLGSLTLDEREGNSGNTSWYRQNNPGWVINWMGMPNAGMRKLEGKLADVFEELFLPGRDVKIGVSIASANGNALRAQEEIITMCTMLLGLSVRPSLVEINIGCPNIQHTSGLATSPNALRKFLADLEFALRGYVSDQGEWPMFTLKVPPYSDPGLLAEMGRAVQMSFLDGVVTMNTFPNSIIFGENGKPVINKNPPGFGGLSGHGIFPMALGQVAQWREALDKPLALDQGMVPERKFIIGGGGVCSIEDYQQMRQCGADAVFVVSALVASSNPTKKFDNLLTDFINQCC